MHNIAKSKNLKKFVNFLIKKLKRIKNGSSYNYVTQNSYMYNNNRELKIVNFFNKKV